MCVRVADVCGWREGVDKNSSFRFSTFLSVVNFLLVLSLRSLHPKKFLNAVLLRGN